MIVGTIFLRDTTFLDYGYIVAFSLFILGLHYLTRPQTARHGNRVAAVGMAVAVIDTLLRPGIGKWGLILVGVAIGTAVGIPAARSSFGRIRVARLLHGVFAWTSTTP